MLTPEYSEFYDRLIRLSERFIDDHCKMTGSLMRVRSGEADPRFIQDYRCFAFTKGTKSLLGIRMLLEAGHYEDALILSRTVLECYMSARYFDENFSMDTLRNMVVIPTAIDMGFYVSKAGSVVNRMTGETVEYTIRNPEELIIGRDNSYFHDLYDLLCQNAHCNISQADAFLDEHGDCVLYTEENALLARLLPLFIFSKMFESTPLLETVRFRDEKEEKEYTDLLIELDTFLYQKMAGFSRTFHVENSRAEKSIKDTVRNMMNSLKEQLGRVDKEFVKDLEKQNTETTLEKDLKPALLSWDRPSAFFEELREKGKLSPRYAELKPLIGLEQDPVYHPEGDVWTHTMQVLDRAANYRDRVSDPYAFMLLALCHDIGKTRATTSENGRIRSVGHETAGLHTISVLLNRITNSDKVKRYVLSMVPWHMKPNIYVKDRSREKSTDRLFSSVPEPLDLVYMSIADKDLSEEDAKFLMDRYESWKKKEEERKNREDRKD